MGWLVGTSTRTPTRDIWITARPYSDRTLASRILHAARGAGGVAVEIDVRIRRECVGIRAQDDGKVPIALAMVQPVPEHVRVTRHHLTHVAQRQRDDAAFRTIEQ